jgi:hypothetical protein
MKTVKFGKKNLKLKEMSLGLRRDTAVLLLKLKELTKENAEQNIMEFLHEEENIKNLFNTFIVTEDVPKLKDNWFLEDAEYLKVITLANEILTSFFVPKTG